MRESSSVTCLICRSGELKEFLNLGMTALANRFVPASHLSDTEPAYPLRVAFCAGCGQKLFVADRKFESGTGWPSFFAPLEGSIGTTVDRSFFMTRTEVHCSRCGGHLGHVFPDGPPPTGQRYCMNGVALNFEPAAAS